MTCKTAPSMIKTRAKLAPEMPIWTNCYVALKLAPSKVAMSVTSEVSFTMRPNTANAAITIEEVMAVVKVVQAIPECQFIPFTWLLTFRMIKTPLNKSAVKEL